MKKLIYLLTVLTAFAAQAQTITEKDLLGEWHVFIMSATGITANFNTDEVTFTPEMQKMIEESGDDLETVKPMILADMKASPLGQMKMLYKPGLEAEWTVENEVSTFKYTIVQENDITYLVRGQGSKMRVNYKDGILTLMITPEVSYSFEKVQ